MKKEQIKREFEIQNKVAIKIIQEVENNKEISQGVKKKDWKKKPI